MLGLKVNATAARHIFGSFAVDRLLKVKLLCQRALVCETLDTYIATLLFRKIAPGLASPAVVIRALPVGNTVTLAGCRSWPSDCVGVGSHAPADVLFRREVICLLSGLSPSQPCIPNLSLAAFDSSFCPFHSQRDRRNY